MTEKLSAEMLQAGENYLRTAERAAEAAIKSPFHQEVTLCAATKTVPPEIINYTASLGLRTMGENRVQELMEKYDELSPSLEKQFIGTLQKNKLKYLVDRVSLIQSLGSLSAAAELERLCSKKNKTMRVLIEINSGREAGKSGILPEELEEFLEKMEAFEHVSVCGLMTIGPICAEKAQIFLIFEETYQLFIDIYRKKHHNIVNPILSMGMSDNFEEAIACGANMIRPGSAIFGRRPPRNQTADNA